MIILGLTGSIGMGKSTTAKMFAELGVPVHDSDATVHALYRGAAVPLIEAAFPGTTANGEVQRDELGKRVFGRPEEIARLEAIVHPLVHQAKAAFLAQARTDERPVVVLDIPLLFETGGEAHVDKIVVVTAPEEIQRDRVLARGVSEERLAHIRARQLPDAEKRARADFIVDTADGLEAAAAQIRAILRSLGVHRGDNPDSGFAKRLNPELRCDSLQPDGRHPPTGISTCANSCSIRKPQALKRSAEIASSKSVASS